MPCLCFCARGTPGCNGSTRETNAERAALRAAFPRSYQADSAWGPQSAVGLVPSLHGGRRNATIRTDPHIRFTIDTSPSTQTPASRRGRVPGGDRNSTSPCALQPRLVSPCAPSFPRTLTHSFRVSPRIDHLDRPTVRRHDTSPRSARRPRADSAHSIRLVPQRL